MLIQLRPARPYLPFYTEKHRKPAAIPAVSPVKVEARRLPG
ncbi:hypothetical protein CSIRO_1833 [Bradyrhizobiaceae bacterium SG-6C]|nr:hypothetical protein CSIRO_1833 [Bradyrhizobiaceae bacterium SG-6C]